MIVFDGQELKDEWIQEYLQWIPEKKNLFDEEAYRYSKGFVKALGLKSDSVGWCTIGPSVDEELVKKIYQKATEENTKIRADYYLGLSQNYPSEWYILRQYSVTNYAEELEKVNKEFNQEMELEELVEVPKGSVVFGGCADGEYILLLPDNTVARYQVGENFFETQWKNLDDFIYEAIMEEE